MSGRNRWVKLGAVGLALVLLFASAPCLASNEAQRMREELRRKESELRDVESQLQGMRRRLSQVDSQRRTVLQELRRIEQNLDRTEAELADLERKVAQAETEVAEATEDLRQAEEELARRKELLARRVRALYELGSVTYLEVLFGAKTFADFVTRLSLLKRVVEGDSALVAMTLEQRDQVAARKVALEDKLARLAALRAATADKKKRIEVQVAERGRLLDRLEKDKAAYEEGIRELERQSERIKKEIQELQAYFRREKLGGPPGTYLQPVPGRITSPFGPRIHPIFRVRSFHTGIDIGAPMGTDVRAAHHGVVLYTGWLGGYGKVVIVDHGEVLPGRAVSTLYAHNSSILVREDEAVVQGQVIARVGSTGFSTGPHVHFEVRENGEPVDPVPWLRK